MHPRITLIAIVLVLFVSCSQPVQEVSEAVHILFPSAHASFEEGTPVSFVADKSVQWYSSLDGYLGEGKTIVANLQQGAHSIRAQKASVSSEVAITIAPLLYTANTWRTLVLRQLQQDIILPAGAYAPLLCGDSSSVTIAISQDSAPKSFSKSYGGEAVSSSIKTPDPIRDVQLVLLPGLAAGNQRKALYRSVNSFLPQNLKTTISPGDINNFHVADPSKGTGYPGWEITARCVYANEQLVLWVDTEDAPSDETLNTFFNTIVTRILPRVQEIIGVHLDPDEDGVLNILMTGKLNSQRLAIGFFNPCDFFPYNDNQNDQTYNPTSNEKDILYCGIVDEQDSAFSFPSLLATVAHEYQHLCRFSRKTYSRLLQGWENPPLEDTAFDEASSHLMENLVGYGISGGNIKFVQQYLQNPENISLTANDRDGNDDSAGKRGMGALFLFYLMEQQGGFHISGSDLCDDGGIAFIRNSIDFAGTGWAYIQQRFGQDLSTLLYAFGQTIVSYPYDSTPISIISDPATGEPITLHPYLGSVSSYTLNGPAKIVPASMFTLLPYSLAFLDTWQMTAKKKVAFSQSGKINTGLIGFYMTGTE